MKSEKLFLLGVSASWCTVCCIYEDKYAAMLERLQNEPDPPKFARIDVKSADFIRKFIAEIDDVPKLYAVVGETFYPYTEETNAWIMFMFVKRMQDPVKPLNSVAEYRKFWADDRKVRKVLGVVFDSDRDEESDYARFMRMGHALASMVGFEVAIVTDRPTIKQLKTAGDIQYFDAVVVRKASGVTRTLDEAAKSPDTDTFFWVLLNSLELVEELTTETLAIYHRIALPMLLLFVDPKSLHNDYLLEDAAKVAENVRGKVSIAWIDGTTEINQKKRKDLGLMTSKLPAAAFNLQENRLLPFDESKPLTYENMNSFVSDFLANRLVPKTSGKPKRNAYELDAMLSKVKSLTYEEFAEKVINESEDVCVFFYSTSESDKEMLDKSRAVAQTFAQLHARLADLSASVKLYRFDLSTEASPRGVSVAYTPSIYLFPAHQKSPPYPQFVGNNHYMEMFFFVAGGSDREVPVPKLKDLTAEEQQVYSAVKASLPKKITDKVEADERVKSAEWL